MATLKNFLLAYHLIVHLVLGILRDILWEHVTRDTSDALHARYEIVRLVFSLWISVIFGWILIFMTWFMKNKDLEQPLMQLFMCERTTIPISLGLLLSNIVAAYTDIDYDIYFKCFGCFSVFTFYILLGHIDLVDGAILLSYFFGAALFLSHTKTSDITMTELAMLTTTMVSQLLIHLSLKARVHFSGERPPKSIGVILSYNIICIGFGVLSHNQADIPWGQIHLFIIDAVLGYLLVYATYFLLRKVDSRVTASIECIKGTMFYVIKKHSFPVESIIGFVIVIGSMLFYLFRVIWTYRGKPEYKRN